MRRFQLFTCTECNGTGHVFQMAGAIRFNLVCPQCGGNGFKRGKVIYYLQLAIILAPFVVGCFYWNWNESSLSSPDIPIVLYWGLLLALGISQRILRKYPQRIPVTTRARLILLIDMALTMFALAAICWIIGLTSVLRNFFVYRIKLGHYASNILATLMTWAISGVVGNFAFEFIKRKLGRKRGNQKQPT